MSRGRALPVRMQYPPAVLEAGNGEPFGTLALLGKPDTKTVLSIPTSLEPTTVTLPDGRTALYIYLRRERTDGEQRACLFPGRAPRKVRLQWACA